MNCDCGAEKHGWTHSDWCSNAHSNQEIHVCEGHVLGCIVSGPSVQLESSRTMYHWDGAGKDPNADIWLCRDCAKEHNDYWDEMWAMVYNDRL